MCPKPGMYAHMGLEERSSAFMPCDDNLDQAQDNVIVTQEYCKLIYQSTRRMLKLHILTG